MSNPADDNFAGVDREALERIVDGTLPVDVDEVIRDWARDHAGLDGDELSLHIVTKAEALGGNVKEKIALLERAVADARAGNGHGSKPPLVSVASGAPATVQPEQAPAPPPKLKWMTGAELAELVVPEPAYICPPYVARGLLAQFVSKTKGGKTELMRRFIAFILTGRPFLGRPTTYTPVAYLTEESPASFGPPLDDAGIPGRDDLHILFRNACGGRDWSEVAPAVHAYVREHGLGLLIVDTGDPWLLHPGDDPNDAVTAEAAVRELQRIAYEYERAVAIRKERGVL